VQRDYARAAQIQALLEGRPMPEPDPVALMSERFQIAAGFDPDVARAFLEMLSVLTLPQEIMARPGMMEKVMAASEGHDVQQPEGPARDEIVALIGN
jgi:hypothetical protein